MTLRDAGYETVMVNCNPETVSTDYDTSDRLYFEPLTDEDVANVLDAELAAGGEVVGVIVSLGGQTPLKLAGSLPPELVLGTSPASIDLAEDRERWNALCAELSIPQPPGGTATTTPEALAVAGQRRLPRAVAAELRPGRPGHGDRLRRRRRAPGHAGDDDRRARPARAASRPTGPSWSTASWRTPSRSTWTPCATATVRSSSPASWSTSRRPGCTRATRPARCRHRRLSEDVIEMLERHTRSLADALGVRGLFNVQFAVKEGQVYVLEANPRASRTVPFVAKATGVPLAMVASRVMVGQTLADLRKEGLLAADAVGRVRVLDHVSVKEAVLPFDRFPGVDTLLGPEMRSTGEVMGVDITFGLAFAKSQMAAGTRLPDTGTVFLSLADRDKPAGLEVARAFSQLGFSLAATLGTAGYLRRAGPHGRHVGGQGGGGGRGVRRGGADRPGQGAARREHAAWSRAAGRRAAHPRRRGGLQGPVPHHPRRRPGRGRRHGRCARRTRSRCARSKTCTRQSRARPGEPNGFGRGHRRRRSRRESARSRCRTRS